jgi:hypothetical protein
MKRSRIEASILTGLGSAASVVPIDTMPLEVPPADEPAGDDDEPLDPFDPGDEDDSAAPVPGWLGAIGQMAAALLVVVALVALFIGAAAVLRRLLP